MENPLVEPLPVPSPEPSVQAGGFRGGLKPGQYRDAKGIIRSVPKRKQKETELEAVTWVLEHDDAHDNTPLRQAYRAWLLRDPKGFMAEKRRLEGGGVPGVAQEAPVDEDSERLEDLCRELLREARGEGSS